MRGQSLYCPIEITFVFFPQVSCTEKPLKRNQQEDPEQEVFRCSCVSSEELAAMPRPERTWKNVKGNFGYSKSLAGT